MSGGDWKTMFKAVQDNDVELIRFYIRAGIDINYQHPEYLALPLSESIRYNHLEAAEVLLLNGAESDIIEAESGMTPTDLAIKKKNQKAIDLLDRFNK
ncbi:MAG: ankyrin repeat domain-containing protein [Roseivirga sp.]|nr:ankyrin repeat domain-containing protein [Roseivirga sp.]